MVHVSDPCRLRQDPDVSARGKQATAKLPVKLEIEDHNEEEEFSPLAKKSRPSGSLQQEFKQQWGADASPVPSQHGHYNPLNEPSPLGLRLRKSPSLLELIQMKLSQANAATPCTSDNEHRESGKKTGAKSAGASGTTDKLKASNFPASVLRIGNWECISRYEGDLVAKCYFAKHKLVWEVLDGGLKSKIEIQWSDITALKASCPENKSGTLDIVLARQPLFFKETNPQPRKHTLWQATSDFTGGQASIHRKHFLQCAPGLLSKHFEKLIQCDPRLYSLSQHSDIVLDSPFFEQRCSVFEEQEETKCPVFSHVGDYGSGFSGFHDVASTCNASPASSRSDARDPTGKRQDSASRVTPSPSSVIDARSIEECSNCEAEETKVSCRWDQFKVPGLHPSMSMSDLVNHLGNCISGQRTSGNPLLPESTFSDNESKDTLEEITQLLLSDSQISATSDENSLMSRVNSLCCLLHKDPTSVQSLQTNKEVGNNIGEDQNLERKPIFDSMSDGGGDDSSPHKTTAISRKESVGDLLLNLPRIASLPQFLFNISEDKEYKAR